MGQSDMHLVDDREEFRVPELAPGTPVTVLTQTTLSVDDTRECIDALRRRFPKIVGPAKDDICYATQNRQAAVKQLASDVDLVLVIGAANSSNANRLREVSEVNGTRAHLINDIRDIRPEWLEGVKRVGITAGASTPEALVTEAIEALRGSTDTIVREIRVVDEHVRFGLPPELEQAAAETGKTLPPRTAVR
jgi:4-hydroxy-3-methylbut-2-enyl diphosphate reductase